MKQYFIWSITQNKYIHTGNKNKLCFTNFPTRTINENKLSNQFEVHQIDLVGLYILNKFDVNKNILT